MVKTHEKSRIYAVVGTDNVKNIEKVVLQMEATGQTSGGYLIYLVEIVAAEDYDRTTAEGAGRITGTGARRGRQL